ncbi:e3 ubiquitin-protein ligase AMFR [Caerostris extrusa]|uniref:E3 ubiquitin-protein ligase AMFR n=1 Tax=Caerostris extrusa TaxID=172846 RepID=A0AAV4XTX6_CAEEX|nr:e3 ubiquitin-protein ligase AMFR [Caerostris extrusa]
MELSAPPIPNLEGQGRVPVNFALHPVPLAGPSPDAINLRQFIETGESSDSGLSDNTVRTEESTIVTGGDGCRFSKNYHERESMLSRRKEDLLRKARNKYISKIMTNAPTHDGESASSNASE